MTSLTKLTTVLVFTLRTLAGQVVVLCADNSRSQIATVAQSQSEQKQLISALPDGTRLYILSVGSTVRRLFEGSLDGARRTAAYISIDKLRGNDDNTAMGEALIEAGAITASSEGTKAQIWFFGDAQNRPVPSSRFRGISFNRILAETPIPPGVDLWIRLFGNEPIDSHRPEVHILRTPPDWGVLWPAPTVAKPLPTKPQLPDSKRFVQNLGGGLLVTIFAFAAGLWIWSRHRGSAGFAAALSPGRELRQTQAVVPARLRRFTIYFEGRTETLALDPVRRPDALVGDSPIADVEVSNTDGGLVYLHVDGDGETAQLVAENRGTQGIDVGIRRLGTRKSVRLPVEIVEMRLGTSILRIVPDIVEAAVEEVGR